MLPLAIQSKDFTKYPAEARDLIDANLLLLRKLPLPLLPLVLQRLLVFDTSFPAEKQGQVEQLRFLSQLSADQLSKIVLPFSKLRIGKEVEKLNWISEPQVLSEHLSKYLWSSHQTEQFRDAAMKFQESTRNATVGIPPAAPRFVIAVIGKDARPSPSIFKRLQSRGTLFTRVEPGGGLGAIMDLVAKRSQDSNVAYAHWYVDGGHTESALSLQAGLSTLSYEQSLPLAQDILARTQAYVAKAGQTNAEGVQSFLSELGRTKLHNDRDSNDRVLNQFKLDILTRGSGTQIFSTTYVQWAAREIIRRAQPLTILARFTPRQSFAPMEELLKASALQRPVDIEGSLIDGEMACYYMWLNITRLRGKEDVRYLAWHEGEQLAIAISPSLPGGTSSEAPTTLSRIIEWIA